VKYCCTPARKESSASSGVQGIARMPNA